MKKIVFAILITFLSASSAKAVLTPHYFSPGGSNFELIKIGGVIKSSEGHYFENEKGLDQTRQISKYIKFNLENYGINIPVEIDTFFPRSCYFPGAKLNKYRPLQSQEQRRVLYLFVTFHQQEGTGLSQGSLQWCGNKPLYIPKGWPEKSDKDDYLTKCENSRRENPKVLGINLTCESNYNLGAIIWGITHPYKLDESSR